MAKRVSSPTVLQMESVECGAASLAMILGYHKLFVPLEVLRDDCGVSRDGSKASNILKAARAYGCVAKGYKKEPESLKEMPMPVIVHWNFNHFLVVDGFEKDKVHLNDPGTGKRVVSEEEFSESFTGVTLVIKPGEDFEPAGEPPSAIKPLRERIKGSETAIAFLLLASFVLVIPGLAVPTLTKVFVDDILLRGKDEWLRALLIGFTFSAFLNGGVTWMKERYLLRLRMKLAVTHSAKFLWHLFRLPIPFFQARYAGDISGRVALNDTVAELLSGKIAETGLDLLMVFFYGTLLFMYDPLLTVIGISISSINILILRSVARKRMDENMKLQQISGQLMGVSMSGLQTIETLKATGGETDFFAKWGGHWAKLQNASQDLALASIVLGAVPTFLTAVNTTAILTIGGLRVMEGVMTVGMLIAYQGLMANFLGPINSLVNLGAELQDMIAHLTRLDDIMKHEPEPHVLAPDRVESNQETQAKLTGSIQLNNITFGYAKLAPPLITDFSLNLEPGTRVALIGGSGSGKSTIARLVAGLYQPWEGSISFDGRPKQEWSASLINNSLAVVDQDLFLFSGTIRENITLWDDSITERDVIRAAKDAKIHDEIMMRPKGYDSILDEGGGNLSGGQRQRLEIARALVRNPTVLLMDEATSALDPATEKIIDDNIRKRGCTCLIVAHRLSTIRDCDEIIVLEKGDVIERGDHRRLMEANGTYAEFMGSA